jgi:hypothetical protein
VPESGLREALAALGRAMLSQAKSPRAKPSKHHP